MRMMGVLEHVALCHEGGLDIFRMYGLGVCGEKDRCNVAFCSRILDASDTLKPFLLLFNARCSLTPPVLSWHSFLLLFLIPILLTPRTSIPYPSPFSRKEDMT
jgi:hypothetical protein